MGYYESMWKERVRFLKSSVIIGTIITTVLAVGLEFGTDSGITSLEDFCEFMYAFLVLELAMVGAIMLCRVLPGSQSKGLAFGLLYGAWATAVACIRGNPFTLVLGVVMLGGCLGLFILIAAGYSVYLPISTVYYLLMYKREKAGVVT